MYDNDELPEDQRDPRSLDESNYLKEPELEQTLTDSELDKMATMFLNDHKDRINRLPKRVGHKIDRSGGMFITHFQYELETIKYVDKWNRSHAVSKRTIAHETEDNEIMDDYNQLHYSIGDYTKRYFTQYKKLEGVYTELELKQIQWRVSDKLYKHIIGDKELRQYPKESETLMRFFSDLDESYGRLSKEQKDSVNLSDKVIELRNLEDQVAASEDHTRGLKEKARELSQVIIPKMMQEMNITK